MMGSLAAFLGNATFPASHLLRLFKLEKPRRYSTHHISSCLVSEPPCHAVPSGRPGWRESQEVVETETRVLVGTYARAPLVLARGKGCKLYDVEGREYLDLASGVAVNALGHCDLDWVCAVAEQASILTHVSYVFYSIPQVQCGLGRSGYLSAHEAFGVVPDIMTLAKPLAGGFPIGAVLTTEKVTAAINHGDHGSTFAGGPLICHAALAVLDKIQKPVFLASITKKGLFFKELLMRKLGGNSHVKEVRGLGLLIGIELDVPASPLVDACRDSGLLVLMAGKGNVVRLVPPLIISEGELEHAAEILKECMPVHDASTDACPN